MANYLDQTGLERLVTNIKSNFVTSTQVSTAIDTKITNKADKATTLAGYGITDAKIASGTITLGNNTITPLTSHQSLSNYYTKTEVDDKVSTIPKFAISVVTALPTSNISTTTLYLVSSGDEQDNLYTEYIYVNGAWETLGRQRMDVSNFLTKTDTAAAAAKLTTNAGSATNPVYFANGVPVACTYTLEQDVTADSKLTDTTYTAGTGVYISATNVISNTGVTSVVTGATANIIKVTTGGTTTSITVNNVANATNATSATNASTVNNHTVLSDVPANAKFTDTVYTLTAATDTVLGGIKGCTNMTLTADGTLSLTSSNVTTALGYTPIDVASTISNDTIDALFS